MLLKKDTLYKCIIGILLIVPPLISSIEFNIVLLSLVTVWVLFNLNFKYSKALIKLIFPLIVIFLIAIFSSFFFPSELFNVIKDFFFLAKPILYILIGYFFISKIKDKEFLYKIIIYLGVLFAILHIYLTIYFISNNVDFNVNKLRNYAGRGNALEIFAIVIFLSKKGRELFKLDSKHKKLIIFIMIFSFVCYFSRTVTVSVIILFLAINGYLAITRKGVLYMFGFLMAISLFYIYLFSVDLQRGAPGIEGFLYKLKIAPAEIFDSKINIKDHTDLWDHWRAYEAQKAFEQIYDTPLAVGLFVGKGVGSLVDLEFVAPLNGEGMQYITTLHNGYSYISFKSGFLGLLAFLLFLLILYMRVYIKSNNLKVIITNNLLSGIAIYYMFTTLIVSGIYNPRDFGGIIVGGLLFLNYFNTLDKKLIKTGLKELP
ncbi:O-antigen ligase family protein [Winogradskyella sp. PG-2]|uniref:O-antigen ligase family protein n=1 Tax=Winogradskyella sp. PG-2 TaxID=754409 RepID=UPI0004587357|nr:O-antigen ligase family protein [Winogradskyella sp. PG-2]BAO75579.1 hypothetical protein WPG_1349 [Winogradskyella sp. PG-2]